MKLEGKAYKEALSYVQLKYNKTIRGSFEMSDLEYLDFISFGIEYQINLLENALTKTNSAYKLALKNEKQRELNELKGILRQP